MNTEYRSMIADAWIDAAPVLQAALDRAGNTHTLPEVWEKVINGDAQFWPGRNAFAVSEVVTTPGARTMRIWLAGGDRKELFEMMKIGEAFARQWKCTRVEFEGRPGWEKYCQPLGWDKSAIVMRKEL